MEVCKLVLLPTMGQVIVGGTREINIPASSYPPGVRSLFTVLIWGREIDKYDIGLKQGQRKPLK